MIHAKKEDSRIEVPFGRGKTSPVAADDVANVVATILADPAQQLGRDFELTGPVSQDMDGVAREYTEALGRKITHVDAVPADWERELKKLGLLNRLPGNDGRAAQSQSLRPPGLKKSVVLRRVS